MAGRISILKYMNSVIDQHVDPLTGEVNDTTLAEDAADHFGEYDCDEIPEKYFEYAHEAGRRYEIKTGVTEGRSIVGGLINSKSSDWF